MNDNVVDRPQTRSSDKIASENTPVETEPFVVIVVLNWQQAQLTTECVKSLLALEYSNFQILIVDNGSQDGSTAVLQGLLSSRVSLVCLDQNLGYAGGNNAGIRYALEHNADYVLVLNNDTIVSPGLLTTLTRAAASDRSVAAVTPKIRYMHKPNHIWAAGGEINWWLGRARSRGRNQLDRGQFDQSADLDYATGCCILFRKSALNEIGLFNEDYFAYFEDTEWCLRAKRGGYCIRYQPDALMWHWAGASSKTNQGKINTGRTTPTIYYLVTRNNLWLISDFSHGIFKLSALSTFMVRHVLPLTGAFILLRRHEKLRALWRGLKAGIRRAKNGEHG